MIALHLDRPTMTRPVSLTWAPELMTGNMQIDRQHMRIFDLMNTLLDALAEGKGQEEVGKVLATLSLFVVAHFRIEEALMAEIGYSGLAAHQEAHEAVRAKVEDMVERFHAQQCDSQELVTFMQWWLSAHVQDEDQAMTRFLASTQATPR
jgi:hemerythrin